MRRRICQTIVGSMLAIGSAAHAAPVTLRFTAVVDYFEVLGFAAWQPSAEAIGTAVTGSVTYDVGHAMTTRTEDMFGVYGTFWASNFGCYSVLMDGNCGASNGPGTAIVQSYSALVEFGGRYLAPLGTEGTWQQFYQARIMSPEYQWSMFSYEQLYSPTTIGGGYTHDQNVTSIGLHLVSPTAGLLYDDPAVIALPALGPGIDAHVSGSSFFQPVYCGPLGPLGPCAPLGGSGYRFNARLTSLGVVETNVVPEPSILALLLSGLLAVWAIARRTRAINCALMPNRARVSVLR